MSVDPVGERLRPARLRKGEARRAQNRDENLRHADLAGGVRLPHRHRQRLLEGAIQLAKARVAVTAGVLGDVFVP